MSEQSFWQRRIKPAHGALTTFVAAIGIFNITSQIEALKQLSASVDFLLGYWRYVRHLPFALLNLKLSAESQDALVLAGISFVAADLSCRKKYSVGLLSVIWKSAHNGHPASIAGSQIMDEIQGSRWRVIVALLSLGAFLVALSLQFPWIVAYIAVSGALLIWLFKLKPLPPDIILIPAVVLNVPAMTLVLIAVMIGVFWRAVLYTAGWVLGLIALNWLLVHVIDPLAPLLAKVPQAPPVP